MVEIQSCKNPLVDGIRVAEAELTLVVGIPAYNEESSIASVIVKAQRHVNRVVVCDDGSTDLTAAIAERMGAQVVRHERNRGYGAAVRSLFAKARELDADILVTLDADGQHDPNEIPRVIEPIVHGEADAVIASRFMNVAGKAEMPSYRRLGAKLITRAVNSSIQNGISDAQSGFRAYNRKAMENLKVSEAGMGASVEILLEASKHNLRISEVPSTCKYKDSDVATSSKNPLAHGASVLWTLVRLIVDEKPLQVMGIPGLFCLVSGAIFGVWMLKIYANEHVIITNIALASTALTLIGFFMLSSAITLYSVLRLSRRINGKTRD